MNLDAERRGLAASPSAIIQAAATASPLRIAVTLSLTGTPPEDVLARPKLEPYPWLSFGAHRCRELAEVLQKLGFTVLNDTPTLPTSDDITTLVKDAFTLLHEEDDLFILHVIGYCDVEARPDEPLSRVWLRGPDGQRLSDDVGTWRRWAASAPGRTLLVLDVGAAVHTVAPQAYTHFTRHLAYWIVGAADGDGQTHGGELTSGVIRELVALSERPATDPAKADPDFHALLSAVGRRVPSALWEPRVRQANATTTRLDDTFLPRTLEANVQAHLQRFFGAQRIRPTSGQTVVAEALGDFLDLTDLSLLVVTGKPGAGKSTMVNNAVQERLPEMSQLVEARRWGDVHKALAGQGLAVVDARDQSVTDLTCAIASQLDPDITTNDPQPIPVKMVLDAICRRRLRDGNNPETPVIVLDGFDEAVNRQQLVDHVLSPLAWWDDDTGRRWCRLLVLSRSPAAELEPLRPRDPSTQKWLDVLSTQKWLDLSSCGAPTATLRREFQSYLADRIDSERLSAGRSEELSTAMAAALFPQAESASSVLLEWGEHLVAELWLHQLRQAVPIPQNQLNISALVDRLPRDVQGLVRLDLSRRPPELRAIAWALAFAEGDGWPRDLILPVAQELAPVAGCRASAISDKTVQQALRFDLAFYVRRYPRPRGETTYRLFHSAVAEGIQCDVRQAWPHLPGEVT